MKSLPSSTSGIAITVRGRFAVRAPDGRDLTPANRKERGIVALLAVSADRRRSRRWLESLLWSESPPEKASASLRRALTNLRAKFAEPLKLLESNRHEVWLSETVRVDSAARTATGGELLDLVDAPDPAFDEWLRDFRAADTPETHKQPEPLTGMFDQPQIGGGTVIVIRSNAPQSDPQSSLFEAILVDILASRFATEGASEVYAGIEPDPDRLGQAETIIHLELISMVEGGQWMVHLRALADRERRFLWSGRLKLPCDAARVSDGVDSHAFVSRALTQILLRYHAFRSADKSPLLVMQRAASMLYDPNRDRVDRAEADLLDLSSGDTAPVALAWRGFAQLARRLEFGDDSAAAEAESLTNDALARQPGNALVAAIASRVALDVTGDFDRARYLAKGALYCDDRNPYALQAAARIEMIRGEIDDAHTLAQISRATAQGMQHVFAWDFELCLTSLAKGDFEAALIAAKTAHQNNPSHRASLRYLVATSLLVGDTAGAQAAAARLAKLEPGFQISDLSNPDYPVLTLRHFGLVERLHSQ